MQAALCPSGGAVLDSRQRAASSRSLRLSVSAVEPGVHKIKVSSGSSALPLS